MPTIMHTGEGGRNSESAVGATAAVGSTVLIARGIAAPNVTAGTDGIDSTDAEEAGRERARRHVLLGALGT